MVVVTIEMKLLAPSSPLQDGQRSLVMACVSIETNKRIMTYKTPNTHE
jgi:hypothetical protein